MIELARHIEVLLLNNDCVIVPDLGGFVAHHVDARYEADEHLFLPPQRTLGFNPQLRMNDSLLAHSYVETYDISYPEAVRRIEDEVNELRQHLASESTYELSGIGVLSLNDDGKLEFSPCEAGILTPGLYGLSTFEMLPLNVEKASTLTGDTTHNSHGAIIIHKSWLRNAVAVAAAVVCFFLFTTPVSNSTQDSDISLGSIEWPMTVKREAKAETAPVAQTALKQEEDRTDTVEATATTLSVTESVADTVSQVPQQPAPTVYYCIVLASEVAEGNANDFVNRLHKEGFDLARVYVHNKIRRVIYGSYPTETEAYNELRKLRSAKHFKEAWVYKVKEN